jgi:hypothetical protein
MKILPMPIITQALFKRTIWGCKSKGFVGNTA